MGARGTRPERVVFTREATARSTATTLQGPWRTSGVYDLWSVWIDDPPSTAETFWHPSRARDLLSRFMQTSFKFVVVSAMHTLPVFHFRPASDVISDQAIRRTVACHNHGQVRVEMNKDSILKQHFSRGSNRTLLFFSPHLVFVFLKDV